MILGDQAVYINCGFASLFAMRRQRDLKFLFPETSPLSVRRFSLI